MKKSTRTILAVLLGSLSATIPVMFGAVFERPGPDWLFLYLYLGGMAYGLSALAYLALVLLPTHLLLVKNGWDRWWVYVLIGAVFAFASFTAFDLWTGGWAPRQAVMPTFVGVLASLTFWAVLHPREPGTS